MSTKVNEALKAVFVLLMAPVLFLIWAAKRLAFAVFVVGAALPLLPKGAVDEFLGLPLIERVSPVFVWLIEHGSQLCLLLSFLLILSLLKKIDRLQTYQEKQAFILGGLMHYLDISDFRFSYAIEEAKRSGFSFERGLKQWFRNSWGRLIGGDSGREFIAGTDPFDTALKRGDRVVTLKDDIKRYLEETTA
jgi:hypothetical protein